ncbi:MAG: type II CAAX endopeptidase family protein [Cyanobacteria bacterium P01_A01_bin.105]
MTNPFLRLKSRYFIFATFLLVSLLVGMIYGLLVMTPLLPWSAEDPISTPILTLFTFGLLALTLAWSSRRVGLQFGWLFGPRPSGVSWWYFLLLVLSGLLFSMGSFFVVFYPLSLLAPDLVSQLLSESLLQTDTALPQTYRWLTIFLAVGFAPMVEEFIFRGILLQRWAMKWGLRGGMLGSSVLFGVLHPNPVGLTMFGLVMALLYVRTRSLWMPILAHMLNNLLAVASELLPSQDEAAEFTLQSFQQTWWMGLVFLALALPVLLHFTYNSWPPQQARLPYLLNGSAPTLDIKPPRL